MKEGKIIISEDGSHTIKHPDLNEHYHSTYGALAESRHVFIEAGLEFVLQRDPEKINILEVGFGTGLNALLTMLRADTAGCQIDYIGLEKFPLTKVIWGKLNYPDIINTQHSQPYFEKLHECDWGKTSALTENFSLLKSEVDLLEYNNAPGSFDLIFFDAFGPDVQSELWTEDVFMKLSQMTAKDGVLVTYSCKGTVKRALKASGFQIEKIPGPKGKREILRGFRF